MKQHHFDSSNSEEGKRCAENSLSAGIPWSTCPRGGAGAPGTVIWGRPRAGVGPGLASGTASGSGCVGRSGCSRPNPRCGRRRSAVPAVPALRRHRCARSGRGSGSGVSGSGQRGLGGSGVFRGAAPGAVAAAALVASRRSIPLGAGLLNRRCKVNIYSRGEQSSETRVRLAGR